MTGDTGGDNPEEGAFARVTRGRRATDFLVLGGAGLLVVGALVVLGEMSALVAVFSILIMAAFSYAYFAGTADLHSGAMRAARAAAGDEETAARMAAERTHRAELIEALAEPAMYIDAQGRVEA